MAFRPLCSKWFFGMGCTMLILTTIALTCEFVRIEQGSSTYRVGAVTYSFYMIAPGVLCVICGFKKGRALLGATLALNVIGAVTSFVCLYVSARKWKSLDRCSDYYYHYYYDDCDDTDERAVLGLITIPSALMGIISLVGSIYGCIITCPCCLTNEDGVNVNNGLSQAFPVVKLETVQPNPQLHLYNEPTTSHIDLGMTQIKESLPQNEFS
ncbi:uncharacterized protein LOC124457986 [Xenia sp. Carnegie-2017]|uniref:uncharacterized protein LOC124457594 n=1 Tax=Xenia sp. Carnegie-2017 TaxID=2897299 RepID=UPI001F03FEB4|nr:uncharacterized protein LOC124457594 [Xenia sp. Carnegie-2017]XP_046864068.1 uncharacterized protein LOC124457986 [Xenia sp. Carnegie-2017]